MTTLNWRILAPLLMCATLVQIAVPLSRVATSYRAIQLDLPLSAVGILSAAFALFPIFVAVRIGRFNDRHGSAPMALAGGLIVALAVVALWLGSISLPLMLVFTCLLGVGQVMLLSALQMVTTQCSAPAQHDTVLGYFLLAVSLGHMVGPLLVVVSTPAGALYPSEVFQTLVAGVAVILAASCALLASGLRSRREAKQVLPAPALSTILRVDGMLAIIVTSGICVTANDLFLVYFPVMGASRGVDAATIGWLLSLRAATALVSRAAFPRLVSRFGRIPVITFALAGSGCSTAMLMLSQPIWAMALWLSISGFGLGLAIACSLSLILSIAPAGGTATAMSLRLTVNRIGQFAIPAASGLMTAVMGVGGIFAIIGGAIVLCSVLTGHVAKDNNRR